MNLLLHWLGVDNASGRAYLAWSGAGSDLGELAIIGGLIAVVRKHNCEVHKCWRLGRHQTAANHHVCRRHHPDDRLTPGQVTASHQAARQPGPDPAPDQRQVEIKLDALDGKISDLAEAITTVMAARTSRAARAAKPPAKGGP